MALLSRHDQDLREKYKKNPEFISSPLKMLFLIQMFTAISCFSSEKYFALSVWFPH